MDLVLAPRRALSCQLEPAPVHVRPTSRRRRLAPLALAVLAMTAAACSAPSSAAQGPSPSLSADDRTVHLEVDGLDRSYLLQPARGLRKGDRSALVMVLHQEGGTPAGVAAETALQGLRSQGTTLVYPAGVDRSWGAGGCCGEPQAEGVDDVAFLARVFDEVRRETPVDPERQALVGYSSGGMLTYRYLCGRPNRLAAAVVVSGSLESHCGKGISTPDLLAVHGKKDGTIGFSRPIFIRELGFAPRAAESTLAAFTRSAGCSAPDTTQQTGVEVRLWEHCRGGAVEALLVAGGGHGWAKLDATRRTYDFLRGHLLDR